MSDWQLCCVSEDELGVSKRVCGGWDGFVEEGDKS